MLNNVNKIFIKKLLGINLSIFFQHSTTFDKTSIQKSYNNLCNFSLFISYFKKIYFLMKNPCDGIVFSILS